MRFDTPLVQGRLIRRYKRFLADIALPDGREVVAHCPNPGAMLGLADPGLEVWVEPNDDPRKKLRWGLRLVRVPSGALVGVDTGAANRIVAEALAKAQVPGLAGDVRAEVPDGAGSRLDFRVGETFVEVKSVTLRRDEMAEFPDSVTKRGAKHLDALAALVSQGHRAMMLYLVQREDCQALRIARDLDPAYAARFGAARNAGVQMVCHGTHITPHGIEFGAALPVEVGPQGG